jgi:hypothetical protein
LVLPFTAFILHVVSARVLKGGDDLVDNVVPGLTVSSKYRPLVVVNVAGTEGFLEGVFEAFFFGAPLSRWLVENSPYSAILWRRWSSILKRCPVQRIRDFSDMTSILVISACSRTTTIET